MIYTDICTDIELSKVLRVNRSTIFRWRTECGMPVDDLEAARAFAANRKPAAKRTPKVEVDPIPVTGESVYDVRDRVHREEELIASENAGLNVAASCENPRADQYLAAETHRGRTQYRGEGAAGDPAGCWLGRYQCFREGGS